MRKTNTARVSDHYHDARAVRELDEMRATAGISAEEFSRDIGASDPYWARLISTNNGIRIHKLEDAAAYFNCEIMVVPSELVDQVEEFIRSKA